MSRKRDELTDEQWQQLEPLLPAQKPNRGRPNLEHRTVINGILWILKTGAPWRDLPERYGKWQTVASRFYRWQQSGVWERIFAQLQQTKDRDGQINWEVHYVDGSIIRAHQHAAGAKKAPRKRKR
jgi:transposase